MQTGHGLRGGRLDAVGESQYGQHPVRTREPDYRAGLPEPVPGEGEHLSGGFYPIVLKEFYIPGHIDRAIVFSADSAAGDIFEGGYLRRGGIVP